MDHIPQAISRMFACGKLLEKHILRGVLTDGHDWIFLVLKFNDEYAGATFRHSSPVQLNISVSPHRQPVIHAPWPDLIAAILLHWMENSFADLGNDDWFEAVPKY